MPTQLLKFQLHPVRHAPHIVNMSEHWKSTPKYWCKHCACYIRDTKLERQNHEATARHQGNLKRFLRDLHRGHEKEEREKDRARREIERVSGVVSGSSSSTSAFRPTTGAQHAAPSAPTAASLKKQREQLAELGVSMPGEFRGEMAMPGEWSVTSTRVIKDEPEEVNAEAKATGVRKREVNEEDKEEEDAVQTLFKKQKRWGRNSKTAPVEEDEELEALLSGSIVTKTEPDDASATKKEETADVKEEEEPVKKENDDSEVLALPEKSEEVGPEAPIKPEAEAELAPPATGVVFKKRKPKGIRQK